MKEKTRKTSWKNNVVTVLAKCSQEEPLDKTETRTQTGMSWIPIKESAPMPNQGMALAQIEQVCAGAMHSLLPHIWQGTPTYPSSPGDSIDKAGKEAAHQEEETMSIETGCGRLAEAEND
jgi:hypothetical protein